MTKSKIPLPSADAARAHVRIDLPDPEPDISDEDKWTRKLIARLKYNIQDRLAQGLDIATVIVLCPPKNPTRETSLQIANNVIKAEEFKAYTSSILLESGHTGVTIKVEWEL